MATNKPTGDNARKGAVKKRIQLTNPLTKTTTKRKEDGRVYGREKEREEVQRREEGEVRWRRFSLPYRLSLPRSQAGGVNPSGAQARRAEAPSESQAPSEAGGPVTLATHRCARPSHFDGFA
jgi:hypothetical protein